jgi:hypothetical protein
MRVPAMHVNLVTFVLYHNIILSFLSFAHNTGDEATPWRLQRRNHGGAGTDEVYPNGHGCAKECRRPIFVFIMCCCFFARLFSASTPRALW